MYDGAIMMSRTQISLDPELQRRARKRASELGVSFAEYVRRLVAGDIGQRKSASDVSAIFGLGSSSGADVARDKDRMVGEAASVRRRRRRTRR
jgi:hypothetical protein